MNVEVILNEDVANLGRIGDVVKVRRGYARNYLIPRGLAVEADQRNLRAFENQKRVAATRREAQKNLALRMKEKLDALELQIAVKAGEEGKLFGSVTNLDVERLLREQGYDVDRRKIVLDEPIKQIGQYRIAVRIEPEVQATIALRVVAE
jgi:large subunit ribosomal protein L9